MARINLEDVFGVGRGQVLSYIERPDVDGAFVDALRSDKQIIVYGASKQGKTSLVSKYLRYDENINISCSPRMQVADLYKSLLRQLGIEIVTGRQTGTAVEGEVGLLAKFTAKLPLLGGGEAQASAKAGGRRDVKTDWQSIEFNLELPQDICELYAKTGSRRVIILENFHYLDSEVQKQLAFDLRTFQELGLRFVILGVWREKNRLIQYNGDLQDRIAEIPVEPWSSVEFAHVAQKGAGLLNITFSDEIVRRICAESFGSIGVVQELLKTLCAGCGVNHPQSAAVCIDDTAALDAAVQKKTQDYAARHLLALEDIAKGLRGAGDGSGKAPLHLPYYFVNAMLKTDFARILHGIDRRDIERVIKQGHHRGADVRPSDISNLLNGLVQLQAKKGIVPPIFDYDRARQQVTVMDSTFYFFIKNCERREVLDHIPNPLE